MNNKRTNYLIAILNIIVVITMILLTIFERNMIIPVVSVNNGIDTVNFSLYG